MNTYCPKAEDITRHWHIIDADGKMLGRLSTEVANLLRGKGKPEFTPHVDCGDFVIIINCEKIKVSGKKELQKVYHRHSGFPGGHREETLGTLRRRRPVAILERAIRGMIPHTRLGDRQFTHLNVYEGPNHPHEAQQPKVFELVG